MTELILNILVLLNYYLFPGLIIISLSKLKFLFNNHLKIIFTSTISIILVNLSTFFSTLFLYNSITAIILFEAILIALLIIYINTRSYNNIVQIQSPDLNINPFFKIAVIFILYLSFYLNVNFLMVEHDELFQIFIPGNKIFNDGFLDFTMPLSPDGMARINNFTGPNTFELSGIVGPMFNYIGTAYFLIMTQGDDILLRSQNVVYFALVILLTLYYGEMLFKGLKNYIFFVLALFPPIIFLSHFFQLEIAVYVFGITSLIFLRYAKEHNLICLSAIAGLMCMAALLSKEMGLIFLIIGLIYLVTEKKDKKINLTYVIIGSISFIYIFSLGFANQIPDLYRERELANITPSLVLKQILFYFQFYFHNSTIYDHSGFGLLIPIFFPIGCWFVLKKTIVEKKLHELIILFLLTTFISIAYMIRHNEFSSYAWFGGHSVTMHASLVILSAFGIKKIYEILNNKSSKAVLVFILILCFLFNFMNHISLSGKNPNIKKVFRENFFFISPLSGYETLKLINPPLYEFNQKMNQLDGKILVTSFLKSAYLLNQKEVITVPNTSIKDSLKANTVDEFNQILLKNDIRYIGLTPFTMIDWNYYAEHFPIFKKVLESMQKQDHFEEIFNNNGCKIYLIK